MNESMAETLANLYDKAYREGAAVQRRKDAAIARERGGWVNDEWEAGYNRACEDIAKAIEEQP